MPRVEVFPEPIEQEPLTAEIEEDIQVYDEVAERHPVSPTPGLSNIRGRQHLSSINVADESKIEELNLVTVGFLLVRHPLR